MKDLIRNITGWKLLSRSNFRFLEDDGVDNIGEINTLNGRFWIEGFTVVHGGDAVGSKETSFWTGVGFDVERHDAGWRWWNILCRFGKADMLDRLEIFEADDIIPALMAVDLLTTIVTLRLLAMTILAKYFDSSMAFFADKILRTFGLCMHQTAQGIVRDCFALLAEHTIGGLCISCQNTIVDFLRSLKTIVDWSRNSWSMTMWTLSGCFFEGGITGTGCG